MSMANGLRTIRRHPKPFTLAGVALVVAFGLAGLTEIWTHPWMPGCAEVAPLSDELEDSLRHKVDAGVGPLSDCDVRGLEREVFNGNQDLRGIQALEGLTHLKLRWNNRDSSRRRYQSPGELEPLDIEPLAGLANLETLILECENQYGPDPETNLANLDVIADLPQLRDLRISGCRPPQLDGIAAATQLRSLVLSVNGIADIGPIGKISTLRKLELIDNPIASLAPLSQLTNLRYLHLYSWRNRVDDTDLEPLRHLKSLEVLHVYVDGVGDLTPLTSLTQLRELVLSSDAIRDLAPLVANSKRGGLGPNDLVEVRSDGLDRSKGSGDREAMQFLEDRGAIVR